MLWAAGGRPGYWFTARPGRDSHCRPASRVPIDRYAALYNRLNRELDDEAFGLFLLPMRVGSFEFLCRGTVTAPNLAEALQRTSRFLRIVLP